MIKYITIFLLIITIGNAQTNKTLEPKLENIAWISGTWHGEAFGGITEEIWSEPTGGSMMATFKLINDDKTYKAKLDEVKPLDTLIADYQPEIDPKDVYFEKEFILWGLTQFKKLSKYRYTEGLQFKDPYGSYINGL